MYSTRNTAIDVAKGFAILLMIIGHCAGLPYLLRNFIFSFHMPLFFIFSGYFFKLKNIREVINHGNKHLVCPYIITAFVAIFLCLTAQDYEYGCEKFVGAIMSNGGWPNELIGANLPYIGPIWFLLALYWCKIFYSILYQKLKNLKT